MAPSSSYTQHLPEMLRTADPGPGEPFIDRFLAIFEALLSGRNVPAPALVEGLEAALDTYVGELDPAFTSVSVTGASPASRFDSPFLSYLATWVALALDENWDLDRKRRWLERIVPLYQQRGTRAGLAEYLTMFVGNQARIRSCQGSSSWAGQQRQADLDAGGGHLPRRRAGLLLSRPHQLRLPGRHRRRGRDPAGGVRHRRLAQPAQRHARDRRSREAGAHLLHARRVYAGDYSRLQERDHRRDAERPADHQGPRDRGARHPHLAAIATDSDTAETRYSAEVEIKRTNFFDGQFLKEGEFKDLDLYHMHMRRRWAFVMFNQSGVVQAGASDLLVEVPNVANKELRVRAGMAIGKRPDLAEAKEVILRLDSPLLSLTTTSAEVPTPLDGRTDRVRHAPLRRAGGDEPAIRGRLTG